jgi:hypothetical protein
VLATVSLGLFWVTRVGCIHWCSRISFGLHIRISLQHVLAFGQRASSSMLWPKAIALHRTFQSALHDSIGGDDPRPFLQEFNTATQKPGEDAAHGIGAFNRVADRDQIVRRVALMFRLNDFVAEARPASPKAITSRGLAI